MAKYFLGSVGKAEAFRYDPITGERTLAFASKTLTDSGLNITTTKDDIRAGEGAPVQFSFYHDSNVEITLTDVLWKKEYLEAQIGAHFETITEDYVTVKIPFEDGVSEHYTGVINDIPFPCEKKKLAWGALEGTDDWHEIAVSGTEGDYTLTLSDKVETAKTGNFCVRLLSEVTGAKAAEIQSVIIPEELFLIITAPIFAGDACAASKGKAAGHITFEVPRFQLNGAQEFAMNMSQNQTMSLAGVAMASESLECDVNGGKLLRIIEVLANRDWKKEVTALLIDEDSCVANAVPVVYGEMKDGSIMKIDNAKLQFSPNLGTGNKFAAGQTYTITLVVSVDPSVTVTDTVTIPA